MEGTYRVVTPKTVCPYVFYRLKDIVSSYLPRDRYVALAFDHTVLKDVASHLFTNENEAGQIKHTFMVLLTLRLITKNHYQPFGCIYWNGLEAKSLAGLIGVYIDALTDAGLHVVATVCPADQYFIDVVQYMTKIKSLMHHDGPVIFSSGSAKNIVHIFDPPKLLKSFRDYLMQYDCWFKSNDKEFTASWKNIEKWHQLNSKHDNTIRNYEDKIFIKNEHLTHTEFAVKLFSKTVSEYLFKHSHDDKTGSNSIVGTAELLAFFNNVFDTFNALSGENGPDSRQPVTKDSLHTIIWKRAASVFSRMCFIVRTSCDATIDVTGCDLLDKVRLNDISNNKKDASRRDLSQKVHKKGKVSRKGRKQNAVSGREVKEKEAEATIKLCRLPCIHCWMLNCKSISVVIEKLRERRFKTINTKYFNVDNVHCFFNIIRVMNGVKVDNSKVHESIYYELIDQATAEACISPPLALAVDPEME